MPPLAQIPAELPAYGSLGPLFYAFGLITQEELKRGFGACGGEGERAPLGPGSRCLRWRQDCVPPRSWLLPSCPARPHACACGSTAAPGSWAGKLIAGCILCVLCCAAGQDDRDLAAWLRETVAEAVSPSACLCPVLRWLAGATHLWAACRAWPHLPPALSCSAPLRLQVRTADQHDSLKRVIRDMRMALEGRHKLAGIQARRGGRRGLGLGTWGRLQAALPGSRGCGSGAASACCRGQLGGRRCQCAFASPHPFPTHPGATPSVQVGGEFAVSTEEQRRQIDALKALEGCFAQMGPKAAAEYEGLAIRCLMPLLLSFAYLSVRCFCLLAACTCCRSCH